MLSRNIELSVAGVVLDDVDSPTVLLRAPSADRYIAVPVGAFEASAIIMEVEGLKPPRPLTHDLFAELFSRHGCKLTSFELYGKAEEGFLGRIRYRKGFRSFSMEVRPSDGIALALRLKAPIHALAPLFEESFVQSYDSFFARSATNSVLFLDGAASGSEG